MIEPRKAYCDMNKLVNFVEYSTGDWDDNMIEKMGSSKLIKLYYEYY